MMVWRMIFHFQWSILRFRVNLPGCTEPEFKLDTNVAILSDLFGMKKVTLSKANRDLQPGNKTLRLESPGNVFVFSR